MVAVVAAYLTSLDGVFVFDDIPNIVKHDSLGDISKAFGAMAQLTTRSTTRMSFALNIALFGKSPFSFHVVNLLIHLAGVLVLFELVRGSITLWNEHHPPRFHANLIALIAALLWGVHPLGTMAVTYVVQRHESLMALFYLLTLYCLLRGRLATRAWPWYVGSALCCWLGMGAKEVMVTAPLVALVYDRCLLSTSWRELMVRRGWVFALLWVPSVLLVMNMLHVFDKSSKAHGVVLGAHETASSWLYLWTQAGVIVHYLRLCFWPVGLAFDYDWPVANHEMEYLFPALFIVGLLGVSFWLVWKRPPIGFVALSFFFILAPTSSVVPIVDVAFEHRMYLPLACICVLVALGLSVAADKWRSQQTDEAKYQTVLLVGLTATLLLGIGTAYRNLDYHSNIALWGSTVEARPMNLRANHNFAQQLGDAGRNQDAQQMLLRSIAYCEAHGYESFPLHGDLAEFHVNAGQFDQAYQRFQLALQAAADEPEGISPYQKLLRDRKLAETRTSFGALLDLMQRPAEASKQFDMAIELRPDVAPWYVLAGDAYRKSGDLETALARWKKALELDAALGDVARDYAMLLVDAGHYREASERLQDVVQTKPKDLAARYQLARVQAAAPVDEVRRPEVALAACQQLLGDFPQHATEIQIVQAMAMGNSGNVEQAVALLKTLKTRLAPSDVALQQHLDTMLHQFEQNDKVLLASEPADG